MEEGGWSEKVCNEGLWKDRAWLEGVWFRGLGGRGCGGWDGRKISVALANWMPNAALHCK